MEMNSDYFDSMSKAGNHGRYGDISLRSFLRKILIPLLKADG
jgi:hypothetical protein